jgi:hypothetical protein
VLTTVTITDGKKITHYTTTCYSSFIIKREREREREIAEDDDVG